MLELWWDLFAANFLESVSSVPVKNFRSVFVEYMDKSMVPPFFHS